MAKRKKKAELRQRFVDRDGELHPADVKLWRDEAGRPLMPVMPAFDPAVIDRDDHSLWRYRQLLPLEEGAEPVRLGEGWTPLLPASLVGMDVRVKLEYLQATGSYKDRGAAVLGAALAAAKARSVVEDSSGNAGAALAAYMVRLNIPMSLFVPESAGNGIKVRQALACGAEVDLEAKTREEATQRAQDSLKGSTVYASHVYSPHFLAGTMTMAWEIWEQMGEVPDNLVVPVGHGLLLLGLHHGFRLLREAGLSEKTPRIFGVQARACAPVYHAFMRGAKETYPGPVQETIAHGLEIVDPPRGPEILAALRESEGSMLNVSESEIRRGMALAANLGWFVEPSTAVAVAGVVKLDKQIEAGETVVLPLTGTGLKL
jgi:threonine synthase